MNPTFHRHNAVYDMDNGSDSLTQSESNLHIFHKFWLSLIQKIGLKAGIIVII